MGEALHGQEEGDPTDPVYAYNKLLEDMPQEEKATLKRNLFVNASLMQWANSEMKAERYAEARDLYERVLVEGKNDDKVNLVHVGVNLGRCYLKSGQLEKGYEFMIKPLANENLSDGLRETIFMVVAEDWTPEVEFPRVREFLDEYGRVVDSDPFEQPDAALAKVARIHDEYPGDEVVPSAWNLKGDIFAAAERAFEEIEACYLKGRETGLAMDQPETVSYALWQLVVQTAENELWDKTQQHFDEFQENYPESEYRYDALAAALPMLVHQGRADEAEVASGGLKLAPGLEGRLGDIVGGKDDQLAADGKSYVPFKGIVSYFALGFGEKYQAITESHTEQFGGKEVILRPREDAPVEPTEEKPDKKVEE